MAEAAADSFFAKFGSYLTKTIKDKKTAELVELHARNALLSLLEESFLHVPTDFAEANSKEECTASLKNFGSKDYREFLTEQLAEQEDMVPLERASLQMLLALTAGRTTESFLAQ